MTRSTRILLALSLAALTATPAAADDKDFLRPRADSVPPNLLIVFGNSQTMTQAITFTGVNFSTFDGDADSPGSKLGAGKKVIRKFIADNHTKFNIGMTGFSRPPNFGSTTINRKHWVYESLDVDFPNDSFKEPVGTLSRWGPFGEGPCTSKTDPPCSERSSVIDLTDFPDAKVVGPFFGANPGPSSAAYIYLDGKGDPSKATQRIKQTIVEGSYGDAFTDGTLTTLTKGTYSIAVKKEYQMRAPGEGWPEAATPTPSGGSGDVIVHYRPPTAFPTNYFYPTGATNNLGSSIAGRYVGFLSEPAADFSVNTNCSGLEFQSNSHQVPLIKIPRDYYWGQACNPPQDSLPCVKRLLRPQAYIENFTNGSYVTNDPDNPGYRTGVTADKYLDGCDPNVLGAVDNALDSVERTVILTAKNGSQAPIKDALDNIYDYFSDPKFDGFKNGVRTDDPNAICRTTAVIFIYDTFNGCQNDSCSFLASHVLTRLKSIGVKVYTIGFGASATSGVCAGAEPPEGCPLVCIPKYTGATKSNGTTPAYFPVTDEVSLAAALGAIADLVNESQKGFASSTVSTAQANGEQVAFLATFSALNNRSVWNGRVNAYKLDPSGNVQLLPRTIRDEQDPNNLVTLLSPSNNPSSLIWNAGENLADTPGTGATNAAAILKPGAVLDRTTGSYSDTSTDSTFDIKTSFYPGRKIVFSLPTTYPDPTLPTTLLPLQATSETVPENRLDMVSPGGSLPFTSPPDWWKALKALLSPQPLPPSSTTPTSPPAVLTPPISDSDAVDSLRFIWGDRDPIILARDPSAVKSTKLYGDADDKGVTDGVGGLKLGDVFHSSPVLVGPPANVAFFTLNLHDYQSFRTTYQHRRRVLAFGANDGLLHIVDAGAWDRERDKCDLDPGPPPTRKHCFDLGTGAELFAYAPRATMQIFKGLKDGVGIQSRRVEWTVDGPPTAGDVFIDSSHTGTPNPSDRTWHTVLIGGMREGSPFEGTPGEFPADSQGSYYALDITQPDALDVDADGKPITFIPGNYNSPRCLNSGSALVDPGDSTCGHDAPVQAVRDAQPDRAWPTVLWEITDVGDLDPAGTPGDTFVDMGETWSKPALGRVKVCSVPTSCDTQSPVTEDHYVAIFGGGFDRERLNRRGNWLYMVDVETGEVVYRANSGCANGVAPGCSPVYFGSIPSEPAAIDGNSDGYIDVLYVGDLNGRMWRIDTTDLRSPAGAPTDRWSNKIDVDAGSGRPFLLFEAPQPATPAIPPRPNASGHPFYPIYFRPTVIALGYSVGGKPAVGIGFGTGDRDDITGNLEPIGLTYKQRFYYVVDRNNGTTRTETDLFDITSSTAASLTTAPLNGWFLELALGERINADILTTGGVIYFTTFNPLAAGNAANPCAQNTPECGLANGTARLYRVNYSTGNPYIGGDRGEVQQYGGFLSEPVYFQSLDQQGNIIYTTENTVKKETAPGGKKTTVKSWKERSRRP